MFLAGFYGKKSLSSHSRIVVHYALSGSAFLVKRCHGRLLRLFELFPNDAKIKTRKAWSEGVPLSLVYYIQTYNGFPSTVSLTKTDKKGREKKEQLVKDVIWMFKAYKDSLNAPT